MPRLTLDGHVTIALAFVQPTGNVQISGRDCSGRILLLLISSITSGVSAIQKPEYTYKQLFRRVKLYNLGLRGTMGSDTKQNICTLEKFVISKFWQ